MGNLRDVPSFTCAAVDFLNISGNVYNAFKSSILGDRKGNTGSGFLSVSISSMDDFFASNFDDKYGNWNCCGRNSLYHLHALLPSW